ncbi:MAG: glycosyltransferase [Flavobacteriales bacterium TMED235]|nr:MAG: glycosyltransferase [Flavobacteriales bacterium TMED235]
MNKLKYLISNSRKFHHPEVAKVLYNHNKLVKLVCGSPWYKLKNKNIPRNLIDTNFIINVLRYFLPDNNSFKFIHDYLNRLNVQFIDYRASKFINNTDVFLGLSKTGLKTGKLIKKLNKIYICERSSSHIIFQNEILRNEYNYLGLDYTPIDKWSIDRELKEYENSDIILVPSKFVENTFKKKGNLKSKVINFGSYQDSFFPIKNFKKNENEFNILFVGQLSVRKGLHYLIEGFKKFKHSKKKLHIIGPHTKDKTFFKNIIKKNNENNIFVHGTKSHSEINKFLNNSHVFVLPSLEEGLATVTLQASSSGCPSIVSENTGAAEFVNTNNCGYVIPIKNSEIITDKLTSLADNKNLMKEFTKNSLEFSKNYTWENYVIELDLLIDNFIKHQKS